MALSSSNTKSSMMPVEGPAGARPSEISVDPFPNTANANASGGGGVPGPSVPGATAAVVRGDIANGVEMFLECMSRRRLKLAAATAAASPKQGGVPACNVFLRALGDAGRIDDCVAAYEAMLACQLRPTIVTFSTLISRAGACRRVRLAERFFREMLEAGITPDVQAINSLINAFAKAGSPDQALKVFDQMSRYGVTPSVITFNTLIDACGRAGDIDRARQVFSRLSQAGLSPNDRTFSALIHSHAVQGQVDEAFSWLQEMRARGLEPNRVTYSALINACGRAGQLARAFQTLDEMFGTGIEPNVVTWTTLIDACGKGKELEWSFKLFKEMRERGTVPNGVTCSALMDACLKADELDLAFAVLEHMLDVGIEPTEVTYTSLLTQCARLGQADRAGIVLDELNKRRPNSSSSGGGGGRNGDTNAAEFVREVGHVDSDTRSSSGRGTGIGDVARKEAAGRGPATAMAGTVSADPADSENVTEAFFSGTVGITPGPAGIDTIAGPNPLPPPMATAEAITRGGATTGEGGSGETATARGRGAWRMNRKLESDLLQLFGQADQVDAAFKVLEGMVERRDSPDGETWLLLLNAVDTAGALDKAVELMERSRAEGHGSEINELTYSALLGACGRAKKLARAFRIVQSMRETGVKPTEGTYLALMEVCRHSRDSKAAVEVFEAMETEGVRPGVRSYTSLLKAISEENTLRTRALQRTRMLETRRSPPSSSAVRRPAEGSSVAAAASAPGAPAQSSPLPSTAPGTTSGGASTLPRDGVDDRGKSLDVRADAVGTTKVVAGGGKGPAAAATRAHAKEEPSVIAAWSSSSSGRGTAGPATKAGGVGGYASSGRSEASLRGPTADPTESSRAPSSTSSDNANPALDNLFRVFLVFQEMRSRGVRPDLRAYNALVNTCADLGEFDRALGVVRLMVDDGEGGGLQPDAVTYTSLIKAAARAVPPRVEEAEEIFATMQQRTNHFSTFARPTEVTYAHLMRASVMAEDYGRALEIWRQQLSAGVAPGPRSTRAALAACGGAGDVDTALQVYDVMREGGIRPNSRALLDLVNLCRANGLQSVAARIMRERSKTDATTNRRRSNVSMRRNSAGSTSRKRNKSTRNTCSANRGSSTSRSTNTGGNTSSSGNGGGSKTGT
ncbi:conserved unknown protein [Ectocarpus siliculosus]|uniref:PROP1-like PPR domain-containing protein n=1 Tax=Ectocarpus siliculosus TaxID=2880 RepID=D8LSJ6_ECTSI|nr:conserved unknown protein [Ectocarpus siliculosus]|eukprot:CBN77833.1 conserved unknown protein [Ectocarpus siliculosus]